ncbi:MAG: CHASE2 domain-containing protein [Prochlorotrichaceae cyanobacterium]
MNPLFSYLKKYLWDWRAVLISAPGTTLLILLLRWVGGLQFAEWAAYDQYMRVRPPNDPGSRIVIVGVDEVDFQEIGLDPIPDGVLATAIEKIAQDGPTAIGLDYYRNLPIEPGHDKLLKVFEETSNLIGIEKVVGETGRDTVGSSDLLKELGRVGANDVLVDGDQRVRRGFISIDLETGETAYSFSFYLALLYLDAQGIGINVLPDGVNWTLGEANFPRFQTNDGGYVRTDDGGHQILINYQGGSRFFPVVSLRDILNDRLAAGWAKDKVVLIGPFSEASKDYFYVPYSSSLLSLPEPMYGVEIHGQLTSQFIQAALGETQLIRTWNDRWEVLWIFAWSIIGGVVVWQSRKIRSHHLLPGKLLDLRLILRVGIMGGSLTLLGLITYGLFLQGWWVPVVPPMLAVLLSAASVTGYIAQTASDIRRTFGRYLSDEIVTTLLDSPKGLSLGGERRKITILTSDLRGFTALSERLPPEEVIKILNFYLSAMADVITDYRGTIDEFMGDGILVLFGAPTASEDDADRAIACAIAMQNALKAVNQQMREWGLNDLEMGVGINTGEVVVGNIGSLKRTKYGVVGNQVNLTYRVESYTVGGQVIISEMTQKALKVPIEIDQEQQVLPKGVAQAISIYSVISVGEPYNLHLTQEDDEFIALKEPIPIHYVCISGKHVGDQLLQASIQEISSKRAKVLYTSTDPEGIPPALSNIKLNLLPSQSWEGTSDDMYAKVLDTPQEAGSFLIFFTARPPALAKYFEEQYRVAVKP